jgi:hypothetical protein
MFEFRTQLEGKASYWVRSDGEHLGEVILNDDGIWTGRLGFTIQVLLGKLTDRDAAAEALLKAKARYRTQELGEGTVGSIFTGLVDAGVPPSARLTYASHDGDVIIEWLESEE